MNLTGLKAEKGSTWGWTARPAKLERHAWMMWQQQLVRPAVAHVALLTVRRIEMVINMGCVWSLLTKLDSSSGTHLKL